MQAMSFAAVVLAAALPSCANCAAACQESFQLTLRGGRMTSTRYDFVVAFDDRVHHGSCTFAETASCTSNHPALRLRIEGTSFVIETLSTPAKVRVDLTWATGATHVELDPSYSKHEVCGDSCRGAAASHSVDSW